MARYVKAMFALLLFGILHLCSPAVWGDIIVTPSELNVGDQFRLIFVTSGTIDATSSDISVYDAFVQSAANLAGVNSYAGSPVSWSALVSTPTVSAVSRLPLNSPEIYNVGFGVGFYNNQRRLAASGTQFWSGNREWAMNVNEYAQFNQTNVWTGTLSDGTPGQVLGSSRVTIGTSYDQGFGGIGLPLAFDDNTRQYSIYAVSQILVAVPEPSSLILLSFTTTLLFFKSRSKHS